MPVAEKNDMLAAKVARSPLRELRQRILEAAAASKEGHVPSAYSILDILWVLYDRILKIDPAHPHEPGRDYFLLSKGHASLGLYAVLAAKGFFPQEELDRFCSFDGILGGHPHRKKVPGVEASTGSLGHGLPMAVGLSLALRIQKRLNRVYCLIGDGESNEGSIWEAAALAAHNGLTNLCCIVDYNHSTDAALRMFSVADKFAAFGWAVKEIDGHDEAAIIAALSAPDVKRPLCIVANTIKGHGSPEMEQNPAMWHHRSPTDEELPAMIARLT